MFQNIFDSHTHSENSPDATHSVTFMAETSAAKGVQGFSITDHCECDQLEALHFESRLRHSALDVAVAKAAFRHSVVVTTGLELSHPLYDPEGADRILRMQHYDFVLLSLHRLQGYEDFYYIDYRDISPDWVDTMLTRYFDELLGLVRWGRFDALAHMSFPQRYLKQNGGVDLDLTRYREQIDAVLRALVESGKGLEMNTSTLFGPLEATMPPAWVFRRYRELGGELVTIGSDAHQAMDVGRGVRQGMQLLLDAGFTHFAFYRDHKPVMLRII